MIVKMGKVVVAGCFGRLGSSTSSYTAPQRFRLRSPRL
jgi:hypothetical protein